MKATAKAKAEAKLPKHVEEVDPNPAETTLVMEHLDGILRGLHVVAARPPSYENVELTLALEFGSDVIEYRKEKIASRLRKAWKDYAMDEIKRVDAAAGGGSGGSLISAPLDDPKIRMLAQNFTSSVGSLSRASTSRESKERAKRLTQLRKASTSRRRNQAAAAAAATAAGLSPVRGYSADVTINSMVSIDLMPDQSVLVGDDDEEEDRDGVADLFPAEGKRERGPAPTEVTAMLSVALLGDQAVGKSSLVARYSVGSYNKRHFPTSGAALSTTERVVQAPPQSNASDELVQFQIIDTSGAVRDRALAHMYSRDVRAILLVADLSRLQTVETILQSFNEKKHLWNKMGTLVVLVGNKGDVRTEWTESADKAMEEFALRHSLPYCRVSSRTGKGVRKMFNAVASQLIWGVGQ